MTTTDPRTVEEIAGLIAGRMRPQCSLCYRGVEHPVCDGTGQVAEFEMLRKPCISHHWANINDRLSPDRTHAEAGCRGYLLVVTADALMDAGKPYHFQIWWDGSQWRVYSNVFRKGESEGPNYASEDKRMALALALEAALPKETHDAI